MKRKYIGFAYKQARLEKNTIFLLLLEKKDVRSEFLKNSNLKGFKISKNLLTVLAGSKWHSFQQCLKAEGIILPLSNIIDLKDVLSSNSFCFVFVNSKLYTYSQYKDLFFSSSASIVAFLLRKQSSNVFFSVKKTLSAFEKKI